MKLQQVIDSLSTKKVRELIKALRHGANRAGQHKVKVCTGLSDKGFDNLKYEDKLKTNCSDGCSGFFISPVLSKDTKCVFCQYVVSEERKAKVSLKRKIQPKE